ncbi:MAG: PAS domain-containing sensor histidine kinase, partial [Alphaproteobacteria bacterium]
MSKDQDLQNSGLEEQLREALVALEQATVRERQTRLESEFLLESLRDLGFAEQTSEVYSRSLEMLRQSVFFDEAFVLRAPLSGEPLRVVASTHAKFQDASFDMNPHFERVKSGVAIPVYDIETMEEWQKQPIEVRENVISTLSIPVPQEIGATIIICTSHEKGGFNDASLQAAQRFGLLVAQAIRMTRVREDELQTALVRLSSQAERDQTDFMLAAVDALGEGVFVVDAQQRIIVTNERYRQLYGELADMYVPGINIEDIWQLERQSGFVKYMEMPNTLSINDSAGWIGMTRTNQHLLRDGKTIRATDRRLPNGWVVGVRVDISELAEKERDLTLARNEAQAANAVKSEFLATVSHEIRTPLNAILGMLGLIQRHALTDTQHEYVSVAETSARNLLMLLNDILDVSKMEAGKLALEEEDVILAQIVREVVRLYRDAADAKNIVLERILDPALPTAVRADGGRLRQVLINFVSNAIKFTDHGLVKIRVGLSDTDPGTTNNVRLRFSVEDTGLGISREAQERLFQPFEQVGASVEKRQGGTGLGLNICRRIADAMEGDTGAESVVGEGSTFWFEAEFKVA